MAINRKFFFEHLQSKLYPNGLHQSQLDGHVAILDAWEATSAKADDRWLAYMFGTAYHETGTALQPVRETFAESDVKAAARLETAWKNGKLPWVQTPYWRRDADGKYWFGRGLVQITHKVNYEKLGKLIQADLTTDPNAALVPVNAIKVMYEGMTRGSFSGKKLADYFAGDTEDWVGARHIINGSESATKVAEHARSYYASISYTTG